MVRSKLPGRLRAAAGWVLAIAVVLGAGAPGTGVGERAEGPEARAVPAPTASLRGDRQDGG